MAGCDLFNGNLPMLLSLLLLLGGIALLFKGADLFVEGGEGLAERYGLSHTTIGLTVIAFGTSLPEFFVSTEAFLLGNSAIGLANIVGSNIANIGLILAFCMFLRPIVVQTTSVHTGLEMDVFLMLLATAVYAMVAWIGTLHILSGILFLLVFILILRQFLRTRPLEPVPRAPRSRKAYIWTVLGLGGVILGAHLLLTGAIDLTSLLGISPRIIGLSLVAVGTSLPEFATSLVAIYRGNVGISVGNIIGSNIFNLLFILGIGSLLIPIPIEGLFDTLMLIGFSAATLPLVIRSRILVRWWAGALLVAYAIYLMVIFGA
jgi:cation:H+ antiporter